MNSLRKDSLGRAIGKRRDNGSENRGLTEATTIVRGPTELIEGMRALAKRWDMPTNRVWREAAAAYLAKHTTEVYVNGNEIPAGMLEQAYLGVQPMKWPEPHVLIQRTKKRR